MNESQSATQPAPGTPPTQDERTWGMVAHLAAFAVFIIPPVGNIIAPLVIWLTRRETSAFVATEAKEALNFNISVALAGLVCWLLTLVAIGVLLGLVLFIVWVALTVSAAIKASEGIPYRYPVSLRLVK